MPKPGSHCFRTEAKGRQCFAPREISAAMHQLIFGELLQAGHRQIICKNLCNARVFAYELAPIIRPDAVATTPPDC